MKRIYYHLTLSSSKHINLHRLSKTITLPFRRNRVKKDFRENLLISVFCVVYANTSWTQLFHCYIDWLKKENKKIKVSKKDNKKRKK